MKKITADKIMYIYLLLQPLIDLMTAYMTRHMTIPLTIGVIVRGLFLLGLLVYCLCCTNEKSKKQIGMYGLLLLVFGILYFVAKPDLWMTKYLVNEVIYLFKYFYFPLVLFLVLHAYPHMHLSSDQLMTVFAFNALIIAFFIIIPYLTGTGFESYVGRTDRSGTVGWFYAANEVGAILALVFPCIYLFLHHQKIICFMVTGIAAGFSMILLGTKVAFLALIVIEFLWLVYFLIQRRREVGLLWCIVLFILSIIAIPLSPMANNVNSSVDQYKDDLESIMEEEKKETFDNVSTNSLLDKAVKVIFSGRQNFMIDTMHIYAEGGIEDQLFGLGFTNRSSIHHKKVEKLIELDPLDIFFHYGIVGFIIYFMPVMWILVGSLKKLIQRQSFHHFYQYGGCISVLLALGISCTAGHVLGAPGVSTYLIFLMVMLNQETSLSTKRQLKDEVSIFALHVNYGGTEKYLSSLCKMLEGKYCVHLIVTYRMTKLPAFDFGKHVRITYLMNEGPNKTALKTAIRQKSISRVISEGLKSVRILFLREWRNIQAAREIDSRYVITTRPLHSRIVGIYCAKEVTKIATEHNYLIKDKKYVNKMKKSLINFQYLVCVSENLTAFYKEQCKHLTCIFIPNVIDELPEKKSALKQNVLVNVGRLEPEKGQLDLIDIVYQVKKRIPDIKLYLMGDGSLREALLEKILSLNLMENIELTGFLSNQEMEKYLLECGLFVMTSFTESFGLVLLEAMSYGIPCIGFDGANGVQELLKNGTGVLISNRDIEKMASKIVEILSDSNLQKKFADRGYQHCQQYLLKNVKHRWLDLLAEHTYPEI